MNILFSLVTNEDLLPGGDDRAPQTDQNKSIETMDDSIRFIYELSKILKKINMMNRLADTEVVMWKTKISEVNALRDSVVTPLQARADYISRILLGSHETENYKELSKKILKKHHGIANTTNTESNRFVDDKKWKFFTLDKHGALVTPDREVLDFLKVVQQDRKLEVK